MPDSLATFCIEPGGAIRGRIAIPGDKSISHRAIMLGGIAEGETTVTGFLQGADTLATLGAFQQMGVPIEINGTDVRINGVGLHGLSRPAKALDLGNSGTSVRLLTGLLAGQSFDLTLTGDASLQRRPMRRVIDPLLLMGADIQSTDSGTLPVHIHGGQQLNGIEYTLPVASAQLKSCLLLAGLYAQGITKVVEPVSTRDHTERMLSAFGCSVERKDNHLSLTSGRQPVATSLHVPADFSSAAFFIVAASIVPGSDVMLENVGINPTRHALLAIMEQMGACINLQNQREQSGEPVADINVKHSELNGIHIPESLVPIAIDEFPAIMIAAAVASGTTRLTGAAELRVKESDRIEAMYQGLRALGVEAESLPDGMVIQGGGFHGGMVDSFGDHRIAMAFTIAGMLASDNITIRDCENVATSFPGFVELAHDAGMRITHV